MDTLPTQNKRSKRKSKKSHQRRRILFFTTIIIACIFIAQAVQSVMQKSNAKPLSSTTLPSVNSSDSLSDIEISARKDFIICIDPGHGYDDPGCDSEYLGDYAEKDISLSISKLIRDKLEKYGFTVIMTRDSDIVPEGYSADNSGMYTLGSRKRCDIANSSGADLFLSIHCNYFEDEDVSGTRLYYYVDDSETTEEYASLLKNGINDILGEECIVCADDKHEAYTVCCFTEAPAVLAEVGFVTNPDDAKKMLDSKWQDKYAESIAEGMINYFNEFCYNKDSNVNNVEQRS